MIFKLKLFLNMQNFLILLLLLLNNILVLLSYIIQNLYQKLQMFLRIKERRLRKQRNQIQKRNINRHLILPLQFPNTLQTPITLLIKTMLILNKIMRALIRQFAQKVQNLHRKMLINRFVIMNVFSIFDQETRRERLFFICSGASRMF